MKSLFDFMNLELNTKQRALRSCMQPRPVNQSLIQRERGQVSF